MATWKWPPDVSRRRSEIVGAGCSRQLPLSDPATAALLRDPCEDLGAAEHARAALAIVSHGPSLSALPYADKFVAGLGAVDSPLVESAADPTWMHLAELTRASLASVPPPEEVMLAELDILERMPHDDRWASADPPDDSEQWLHVDAADGIEEAPFGGDLENALRWDMVASAVKESRGLARAGGTSADMRTLLTRAPAVPAPKERVSPAPNPPTLPTSLTFVLVFHSDSAPAVVQHTVMHVVSNLGRQWSTQPEAQATDNPWSAGPLWPMSPVSRGGLATPAAPSEEQTGVQCSGTATDWTGSSDDAGAADAQSRPLSSQRVVTVQLSGDGAQEREEFHVYLSFGAQPIRPHALRCSIFSMDERGFMAAELIGSREALTVDRPGLLWPVGVLARTPASDTTEATTASWPPFRMAWRSRGNTLTDTLWTTRHSEASSASVPYPQTARASAAAERNDPDVSAAAAAAGGTTTTTQTIKRKRGRPRKRRPPPEESHEATCPSVVTPPPAPPPSCALPRHVATLEHLRVCSHTFDEIDVVNGADEAEAGSEISGCSDRSLESLEAHTQPWALDTIAASADDAEATEAALESIRRRIRGKSRRFILYCIKLEDLRHFFHMPRDVVAAQLGICVTLLKKISRRNGVMHWPYRRLKNLRRRLVAKQAELRLCHHRDVSDACSAPGRGRHSSDRRPRELLREVQRLSAQVHTVMDTGSGDSVSFTAPAMSLLDDADEALLSFGHK